MIAQQGHKAKEPMYTEEEFSSGLLSKAKRPKSQFIQGKNLCGLRMLLRQGRHSFLEAAGARGTRAFVCSWHSFIETVGLRCRRAFC